MMAAAAAAAPDANADSDTATRGCFPGSLHTKPQHRLLQLPVDAVVRHCVTTGRRLSLCAFLFMLLVPRHPLCNTYSASTTSRNTPFLLLASPSPVAQMCEALVLRDDASRYGGWCGTSVSSSRRGDCGWGAFPLTTQRHAAFISPNFTLRRTSAPSKGVQTSSVCSPSGPPKASSSIKCIGRGPRDTDSKSMDKLQESHSRCYAYRLTFGKEDEPGRVALVTGASRGIGKVIAETLAEGGVSHVLCVAKNQVACDEVASDLAARGFSASGHGVDVGDATAVENLCNALLEKYPRIDILVNNAGITKDNLFIRMSPQEWTDVINVNLNSAFYFTSPLIKRMVKNRFGRVINMSSVVGVGGNPGQANYAASKAGLIGMTRSLGKEYANRGVTVNAVAPGFIKSAMTDAMSDAAKAATLASIPAGRMGDPQDVANMVAFLASDQAAYITGKVMPVDGGMLFGAN